MKRICFVALYGLILSALAYSQTPLRKQPVQVTSQTLTRQPARTPYVIDLTRKGRTYSVAADVTNRVRIRTANGEMALTDLMGKLEVTSKKFLTSSKFLIGTLSDLRDINFDRPPVTRPSATAAAKGLTCNAILCECDPDIEGDCFGRRIVCLGGVMFCFPCDGPECPPERRGRWTCICPHI